MERKWVSWYFDSSFLEFILCQVRQMLMIALRGQKIGPARARNKRTAIVKIRRNPLLFNIDEQKDDKLTKSKGKQSRHETIFRINILICIINSRF